MPARLCQQWRIQGRGPGGPPPPHPISRPNWDLGPKGRKMFLDTAPPPLSQGLDDWGFPLSQGPDDRAPSYFRLNDRPPLISGWMTGSPPYLRLNDRAPSYFRLNDRPPPYLRLNDRVPPPPLSEGLDPPLVKVLYSLVHPLPRAWKSLWIWEVFARQNHFQPGSR